MKQYILIFALIGGFVGGVKADQSEREKPDVILQLSLLRPALITALVKSSVGTFSLVQNGSILDHNDAGIALLSLMALCSLERISYLYYPENKKVKEEADLSFYIGTLFGSGLTALALVMSGLKVVDSVPTS